MRYEVIINNYQKGSKLKTTPTDYIESIEQIDRSHHRVVYNLVSDRQVQFIERVLAKKLKRI